MPGRFKLKKHNKAVEDDPFQRLCYVLAASFGSCLFARSNFGSVAGIASPSTFCKKNGPDGGTQFEGRFVLFEGAVGFYNE
ncbi:hypothetical protein [Haloferula sp.]|uniref:hypothetical protein n=1 Tax=Haloferula sp. TaxID=2497595 RepID=UPI00329A9DE4